MNTWPDGGMTPFRSEKNTNWEGAFRVPEMIRWPGKIARRRGLERDRPAPRLAADVPRRRRRAGHRREAQGRAHDRRHHLQGPHRRLQPAAVPDRRGRQVAAQGPRLLLRRRRRARAALRQLEGRLHGAARAGHAADLGRAVRRACACPSSSTCGPTRSSAPTSPRTRTTTGCSRPTTSSWPRRPSSTAVPRRRSRSSRRARRPRASRSTRWSPSSKRALTSGQVTTTRCWIAAASFRMGSDAHYAEEAPSRRVDGRRVLDRPRRRSPTAATPSSSPTPGTSPSPSARSTRRRSPARRRRTSSPARWCSRARAGRSTCATSTSGGRGRPAPAGGGRRARARSLAGREEHPVVHVAYEDATAFAEWAGRALPTEAQWELAARGGLDGAAYVWGDEPEPPGARLANYWHGDFPWRSEPGYGTTAPVGSFAPNGFGLSDMAGNVWEWTARLVRRQRGREPRPGPAAVRDPAQGRQGRLVPVRRQLLPALPARGAAAADDRHRHEPRRLPLRAGQQRPLPHASQASAIPLNVLTLTHPPASAIA